MLKRDFPMEASASRYKVIHKYYDACNLVESIPCTLQTLPTALIHLESWPSAFWKPGQRRVTDRFISNPLQPRARCYEILILVLMMFVQNIEMCDHLF
jgi:hypothetical protein